VHDIGTRTSVLRTAMEGTHGYTRMYRRSARCSLVCVELYSGRKRPAQRMPGIVCTHLMHADIVGSAGAGKPCAEGVSCQPRLPCWGQWSDQERPQGSMTGVLLWTSAAGMRMVTKQPNGCGCSRTGMVWMAWQIMTGTTDAERRGYGSGANTHRCHRG
jgi:hypothetical protein